MAHSHIQASAAETRICLDFGTAYSKAGAYLGGAIARESVHALALGNASGAEHPLLTPSVIFIDDGRILMGPPALSRAGAHTNPERAPLISFKTILAARDLPAALAMRVRPAIDPTGTLRHRDALVLYLAHLDQLIRAAINADATMPERLLDAPRRYTSPIWSARAEADTIMERLFDEAAIVSERLGYMLIGTHGASIAQCKDALDRGERAPDKGILQAGIFEAHAAAAAYSAFTRSPKRFSLVIDMGAGTTDIAGFELQELEHPVLAEIIGARQCCGLAGDEIDDIIVSLLLQRAQEKRPHQANALWRGLRLSARKLKHDLFGAAGRCTFSHAGRTLSLRRQDLISCAAFKHFARALTDVCAASLHAVALRAKQAGAGKINVLLGGGGANLSFLRDIAAVASARAGHGLEAVIERFGDDWYLPSGFNPALQEAFPQAAIALGGALAELSDSGPA